MRAAILAALAAAICGLILTTGSVNATGAVASTRVDRSFGNAGTVDIDPQPPGYEQGYVYEVASGPRGGIFFVGEARRRCDCRREVFVGRLGPNGARDGDYGRSGYRLVQSLPLHGTATLAIDSRERQLVAVLFRTQIGAIDGSFGTNGTARIPCTCGSASLYLATLDGDRVEVLASSLYSGGFRTILAQLSSRGRLDRDFGAGGIATKAFPRKGKIERAKVLPDGSALFTGYGCCREFEPTLIRFDQEGRFDRGFEARSRRAFRAIGVRDSRRPQVIEAIVPRGRHAFDLLGRTYNGGFVLRMFADGRINRTFGIGGIRPIATPIIAAAADPVGHILAIGPQRYAAVDVVAFWLAGNGAVEDVSPDVIDISDDSFTTVSMHGDRPLLFNSHPESCGHAGPCTPSRPLLVRLQRRAPLTQVDPLKLRRG